MSVLTRFLPFFFLFLPFQFALSPAEGIDLSSARLVAVVLFFWWLAESLVRRRLFFPNLTALFFWAGFLLLSSGSFLWEENPLFGLRKAAFLLSFFPLFLVFLSVFREQPFLLLKSLWLLVVGAASIASVGLGFFFSQFVFGVERVFFFLTNDVLPFFLGETFAQSVAAHPSLLVNLSGATVLRASGIFPDPHMFAFYLGMTAPFALSFFLDASSRRERMMTGSLFALILLADFLTFSRGGYAGLITGLGFFFLVSGIGANFSLKKKFSLGALALLLMSILALSPVGGRFLSSFSQNDSSNQERLRLFQEAWAHIQERPFLGVGLGNYPLLVQPTASYRDPIYIHNLFLDITAELGFIGLALFLGLFLVAWQKIFSLWHQNQRNFIPLAVCSSMLVFLGHAFFETPLFSVHVLPLLLLLLATGVSYSYESSDTK